MSPTNKKPILLLIDGHSLAFRSFYAFSKGGEGGLSTKEGIPTSVTYGFLKSLLENCKALSPQGVVIAFDTAEPTFRHKADPNYKANRDIAPEIFFRDLEQLQIILKENLNLPLCIAPGYEADDVLGTLAIKSAKEGWSVRILSGDRDLFQLVDDQLDIAVLYMGGGPYAKSSRPSFINESGVLNKLGVEPKKVIDFKALTGDSSDNIPGVKGVGPKTAINLLKENGDLDGVYSMLSLLEKEGATSSKGALKGSVKNKLGNDRENAFLSRHLAEILIDIPLLEEPTLKLKEVDSKGLRNSLDQLELNSLAKEIPAFIASFSTGGFKQNNKDKETSKNNSISPEKKEKKDLQNINDVPKISPKIISNQSELNDLISILMQHEDRLSPVALDTETTSLNPFKAELVGIGFCWGENLDEIAYIPIGHKNDKQLLTKGISNQLSIERILKLLGPWLESINHPKALQNAKYDRLILLRHGIILEGICMDTMLADYLIDSTLKHSLDSIAERELKFRPTSFTDVVKKGETFADVDIYSASLYCGMDVYLTRALALKAKNKLESLGKQSINLLIEIEQPLEKVLALMEATGIRVDVEYLKILSKELNEALSQLERKAHELNGSEFNLSSPKQLGELLFENLNLDKKKSRRTKTGWSTDASVLERLENDHPIIPLLIEYRTLSKLKSTYVDALPQLVEEETGRIHTDFNQAVTATGRLSSSNPNLQNIPIRTDFSRRIRKAFLPQDKWKLISADYSQIELRILAHLSGEQILLDAYRNGDDVHALTAKLLLEKDNISSKERRLGKTINFGVIYGMGSQRLARSTGLTHNESKEFLIRYRQRYQKVFAFLELQERLALARGYVETLMGRRRYFHFNSNGLGRYLGKNPEEIDLSIARRGGLEAQQLRAAANAPIQGSSADIIKVAMVKLHKQLKQNSFPARLLLQVHDELVLEVEKSMVEEVKKTVINTMEKAVILNIPLVVEAGIGENWMEVK